MSEETVRQLEARMQTLERELATLKRQAAAPIDNRQRIASCRQRWRCRQLTIKDQVRFETPVLLLGEGSITIGNDVLFGWDRDPGFFDGIILIDARHDAHIEIRDGVIINNNSVLIAEGEGIEIGERALIGWSVEISDSDFHDLDPARRLDGVSVTKKVTIGRNVLIGARAAVLKGSLIGADSVVGYGSIVSGEIPPGVVAAGTPARVLRPLAQS